MSQDYLLLALGDPSLALEYRTWHLWTPSSERARGEKGLDRVILLSAKLCLMFGSQDFGPQKHCQDGSFGGVDTCLTGPNSPVWETYCIQYPFSMAHII